MSNLSVAVIGSGIAGLSAAWLLSRKHRVTVYESESHLGGHAHTTDVATPEGSIAVDTGFIVYNEYSYPNLTALFRHLGVETDASEMSFALSLDDGQYEYAGSGFNGFFGQRRNLMSVRHWRLLRDVTRFFGTALERIKHYPETISLGDFLAEEGYGPEFVRDHIVPMGAAIWSTPMDGMLDFPADSFVRFYQNHGMLQFRQRPKWRTVSGGSRSYVERLAADGGFEVQRAMPVQRIVRNANYVHIVDGRGVLRPFDHVVLATHADQALALLDEPSTAEAEHLGAFRYEKNTAVLHRDARWMPKRRRLWSSWNYLKGKQGVESTLCLTYWMNRLQNLKTETNLFVTLNPSEPIHPKAVEGTYLYDHPVFTGEAMARQKTLWTLQGQRRTWFCGSYFGYGFHEDGAQSGLAVAEQLGRVRRPWQVENESGRIGLPSGAKVEAAE